MPSCYSNLECDLGQRRGADKAKAGANWCVSVPHRHGCSSSRGDGKKANRVRNLLNSPAESHGQAAGTGREGSVLGSLALLPLFPPPPTLLSCFPSPLCCWNILLSRCWLPLLSFCICASVFFLMVSPLCLLYYVCFSLCLFPSHFWSLHPMFSLPPLPPPVKFHKQPQFGYLIPTPSNYCLFATIWDSLRALSAPCYLWKQVHLFLYVM